MFPPGIGRNKSQSSSYNFWTGKRKEEDSRRCGKIEEREGKYLFVYLALH